MPVSRSSPIPSGSAGAGRTGDALTRHVLTFLDEELRRARGEPHLHAGAMGALDDIEDPALVEIVLGEDQLVG